MNGREAIKRIRRIPIKLSLQSDIGPEYVRDRKQIRTPKQLKAFARKWQAVWQIPWMKEWAPDRLERQIISGRFDASLVLSCIKKNSDSGVGCRHILRGKGCVSVHILAPPMLIRLMQITNHFGVPDGIALLQLQRMLHEDIRYEDPDIILGTYR